MATLFTKHPLAGTVGAAFIASLALAPLAHAGENPFQITQLAAGYTLAEAGKAPEEGKCGEGKCGEGKCGGAAKAHEGAGDQAKAEEGKCGEGKCGEGKCGGAAKAHEGAGGEAKAGEGKCGEGKCGAKH